MKRVEHIICIYFISCPISNEVVYIGARFIRHLIANNSEAA